MTIRLLTGFEHGVNPLVTSGGGLVNSVTGTGVSVVSERSRSGRYSFKCSTTTLATTNISWDTTVLPLEIWQYTARFYFYVASHPSANTIIFGVSVSGSTNTISILLNNGLAFPRVIGNAGPSGTPYNLNAWNRVDILGGLSSGTRLAVLSINGNTLPAYSATGTALSFLTSVNMGFVGNHSGTVYYDDFIFTDASTDFPIGDSSIEAIVPASDGTHNAGANIMEDNLGNDINGTSVTAYDKVNWVPMSTGTTWVRQAANGATNYVEVNFGDLSSATTVQGAMARLAYLGETTTANNGGCVIIDEDNLSTTLWGVSGSLADYSESSIFYKQALLRTPDGGWDLNAVNALRSRFGYSSDAAPDPYWRALQIEVAFVSGAAGNTYEDSLALPRLHALSADSALSYTSALTLGRSHTLLSASQLDAQAALNLPRQLAVSSQPLLTLEAALSMQRALALLTTGGATFDSSLSLLRQMAVSAASGLTLEEDLALSRRLFAVSTAQTDHYPTMTLAHSRTLAASAQLQAYASALLASYRAFSASSPSGVYTYVDGFGGDIASYDDNILNGSTEVSKLLNLGVHPNVELSPTQNYILRFNLDAIPSGATCQSAKLYLYKSYPLGDGGGTINANVYSIAEANRAWRAGTGNLTLAASGSSCWNALAANGSSGTLTPWAGGAFGCGVSGTDYEPTSLAALTWTPVDDPYGTEYLFNLTPSRISGWFGSGTNSNHGLILLTTGGGDHVGSADNATGTVRPKLVVEWLSPTSQTYNETLSLSKQVALLDVSQLDAQAAASLQRLLALTTAGGADVQAATTLGRVLGVLSAPNLTVETSLTLSQRRSLSTAVNALYYTALTLAASLSLSASPAADYQTAVSLLRQMALTTLSEVGAQTYEATLTLSKQLALSAATLATQFVTSPLGRSLTLAANASADMNSQLSLSRSLQLSFLGGLLLEGALTLNRVERATDSASLTAEASIGLGKSAGVSDSPTASLLTQLNLGRTVALSPSVQAAFETDARLGKVLALTIQGGLVYTEQVALELFQALATLSQLVQASLNFPAKLVIGDQTIWLMTTTDQLVSNNAIINTEPTDLTAKDTDSL